MTLPALSPDQAEAWDAIAEALAQTGMVRDKIVAANPGLETEIVVVNTVNYVRDRLGGSESQVAWMLAASGGGTLLVALAVPPQVSRAATLSRYYETLGTEQNRWTPPATTTPPTTPACLSCCNCWGRPESS